MTQSPDDGPLSEALTAELCARGRVAVMFLVPVLFILRGVLSTAYLASAGVRAIFIATVAIAFARGAVCWLANTRVPAAALRPLVVGSSALLGALLGVLTWMAHPHLGPLQIALAAVCITGLNSVALLSLASSRLAYFGYMLPSLGGLAAAELLDPRPGIDPWFLPLLALYGLTLAAMAIHLNRSLRALLKLQQELRDLAHRDSLTGLYNRRFIGEYLQGRRSPFVSGARPGAAQRRLGVVVVDLDYFKRINDRHGHEAGDMALQQTAELLRRAVRGGDVIARWGGEEFLVLVPDLDRASLGRLAERIRERVENRVLRLANGAALRVTCSVGFAAASLPLEGAGSQWKHLAAVADVALARAKANGRNQTVGIFSTPGLELAPDRLEGAIKGGKLKAAVAAGLVEMDVTEERLLSAPAGASGARYQVIAGGLV